MTLIGIVGVVSAVIAVWLILTERYGWAWVFAILSIAMGLMELQSLTI
jgi:hypothetical protein